MKVKEAVELGENILKLNNIENYALECSILLCHCIRCDRIFVYTNTDFVLDIEQEIKYFEMINKRIKGVPLQHLLETQEFYSLNFKVNKNVLIPRQDTEILVDWIITKVNELKLKDLVIADIGTGSGCIAISLATNLEYTSIYAIDISEKALDIAKENAIKNCINNKITFIKSDIFKDFSNKIFFDIIVSNPPYIVSKDIESLQIEVREHEPVLALDGGEDGLDFYRRITFESEAFLKKDGYLVFEIGYNQAEDVINIMKNRYKDISVIKDFGGNDRVVVGQKIYC